MAVSLPREPHITRAVEFAAQRASTLPGELARVTATPHRPLAREAKALDKVGSPYPGAGAGRGSVLS